MNECKTKQMKMAYERYLKSSAEYLGEVYTTWSNAKENAYRYCNELFCKYNGQRLRIIGACSNFFSVGFIGQVNGRKAFFYITHTADRYIYLE